jgi:hypothetical protein
MMTGNIKGMMWFENKKDKTIDAIVEDGIIFSQKKCHFTPNIIYVNVHQYPDQFKVRGVLISPVPNILTNHYWFCADEVL